MRENDMLGSMEGYRDETICKGGIEFPMIQNWNSYDGVPGQEPVFNSFMHLMVKIK